MKQRMKRILSITAIIASLMLFASCDNRDKVVYTIIIDDVYSCSYDEQVLSIDYNLPYTTDGATNATATTNASWVEYIDTSESGKIKVSVSENEGASRKASIRVSAPGYATKTVTISQTAKPGKTSQTLMFYFFGTSLDRYFKTNIQDASTAIANGAIGTDNRVIYLKQRSKYEAGIYELCYDPAYEKCVERHITDITFDGAHITTEQIGKNIALMAEYAPADNYGIVFAGHGQGWIPREVLNGSSGISTLGATQWWQPAAGAEVTRAFGENNVQVNPSELAEGIEKSGIELDYILFDACFMSNIETLYDLRYAADYIIASPCEIMGRGFPYHRTLPYLFADNDLQSNVIDAANSYYTFYRDEYIGNSRCGSVAVVNCNEIDLLADATKAIAASQQQYFREEMQTYEGQSIHQFYDIGEWAEVSCSDNAAVEAFKVQLERTVVAKFSLPTFYSAYGAYGTYDIDLEIYSGVTTSAPCYDRNIMPAWPNTAWYRYVWPETTEEDITETEPASIE